jgi:hypothetical protein
MGLSKINERVILAAAGGLVAFTLPASAAFTLLENFEDLAVGTDLNGANAGENFTAGTGVAIVRAHPGGEANNILQVLGVNSNLYSPLSIPTGTTGTIFFQVARTGPVNVSVGTSDEAAPNGFGAFESQLAVNTTPQNFHVRDAGAFDPTTAIMGAADFYNVWLVVDNSDAANPQGDDTTRLYVQGPGDTAPVLRDNAGQTDFVFRNGVAATNDLVNFYIRTAAGSATNTNHDGPWYIDNIYNAAGIDLTQPAPTPSQVPEPAGIALLGLGVSALGARHRRKA